MAFQVNLYLLKAQHKLRLFYHSIMIFHEEGTGIEKHGSKLTLNPHESTDTSRFYLLTPDLEIER